MHTLLIPPFSSYNPGATSDDGGTPPTPPVETLTITSASTTYPGFNYLVVSSTPTVAVVGDRIDQDAATCFIQGIVGQVVFVSDATGFVADTADAYTDVGGTPVTQLDSVSLSSINTDVAGYPYFVMASAMTNTATGDIIVQGTTVGYVQDRLNTSLFPNTTTGFAGGSNLISFDASVAGAGLSWGTLDLTTLGTLVVYYKSGVEYTESGGVVQTWGSQGTLANHNITQGTLANRPTLVADDADFNGNDSLSFDGTNDSMSDPDSITLTSATAFVVCKCTNDPGSAANTINFYYTGQNSAYPDTAGNSGTVKLGTLTSVQKNTAIDPSPALTTTHFSTVTSASADWKWYLNGNQEYTTGTNTFQAGSGMAIGTASIRFMGKWAEHGVYNAVLAAAKRWMLHKALSVKFAVTLKDLD
jgi:hypothetical protein